MTQKVKYYEKWTFGLMNFVDDNKNIRYQQLIFYLLIWFTKQISVNAQQKGIIPDVLFLDNTACPCSWCNYKPTRLLVGNVYLALVNKGGRDTVWTVPSSVAVFRVGFQTNLPGIACILMLGAYPPVYLRLQWIQGTFGAERAGLICVSHDNNTATIDERSCGNLLQATTGEYGARETE